MNQENPKSLIGTLIIKALGFIGCAILTVSAFTGHRPLLGVAFISMALMFVYEAYLIGLRHRAVKNWDQLPFVVIMVVCIVIDFIV